MVNVVIGGVSLLTATRRKDCFLGMANDAPMAAMGRIRDRPFAPSMKLDESLRLSADTAPSRRPVGDQAAPII